MRNKKVVIFLHSTQALGELEPDSSELMTEGVLSLDGNGGFTVTYQESELTGMEGTTTRFSLQDGMMVLERKGSISSQLIFQEGRQSSSLYETPWGTASVDVDTSYLSCRMGERGGSLELRYTVSINGQPMGKTHIKIRVRETRSELPL